MTTPRPPSDDPRLEEALEQAWDDPAVPAPGAAPADAIGSAMRTFRRERRQRITLAATACALLIAVGIWVARTDRGTGAEVERSDAVAYGNDLFRRVKGDPRDSTDDDFDYLQRDETARAEYLAALDHDSSFVRRVALDMLSSSGIEVPQDVMTRMLMEHREDLERPLQVASVGESGRLVAEAIEARRDATVMGALKASFLLAARGKERLPHDAVRPWLSHEDPEYRFIAISALQWDDTFQPDAQTRALMRDDPSAKVRIAAATIIHRRLGAEGNQELLEHIAGTRDPELERVLIVLLRNTAGINAIARAKLEDDDTDDVTKVAYARRLWKGGDDQPARALLPAVLRSGDGPAAAAATSLARELALVELRPQVIERHAALARDQRAELVMALVRWDIERGDAAAAEESLGLLREDGTRLHGLRLTPWRSHADEAIRAAVQATIEHLTRD